MILLNLNGVATMINEGDTVVTRGGKHSVVVRLEETTADIQYPYTITTDTDIGIYRCTREGSWWGTTESDHDIVEVRHAQLQVAAYIEKYGTKKGLQLFNKLHDEWIACTASLEVRPGITYRVEPQKMAHEELKKLLDAEYAVNPKAIENWQYRGINKKHWEDFAGLSKPSWIPGIEYRRNPDAPPFPSLKDQYKQDCLDYAEPWAHWEISLTYQDYWIPCNRAHPFNEGASATFKYRRNPDAPPQPRAKEPAEPTYPAGTELTFMQAAEWVVAYGSKAGLEMKFNDSPWINCAATDRTIDTDSNYRVKPASREIITGGKVIDAPEEQKPNNGDLFWTLDVSYGLAGVFRVFSDIWTDNIADRIRLLNGLVYKTEAGAQQRADTLFDFEAVK
jgi:hypothetical protein